jgi:prophage regulatory protein
MRSASNRKVQTRYDQGSWPNRLSALPTKKFDLVETGFIRLKNIIAPYGPIPVSKSTWWAGVKSRRFPQPVKLGSKITVWRVEDIRALIERPEKTLDS